jgi:hypothetical protein
MPGRRVRGARDRVTNHGVPPPARSSVRTLCVSVIALLLSVTASQAGADDLWDRAVATADAGSHLVPRSMLTTTREYSSDGKLRSTRETHMRAVLVDGELTYETVRDIQDGQAVAPDADGTTGATGAGSRFSDAFQADLSAMAGAERDGETRTIRGQRAVGYRIEQPEELYTIRGQVWVSEQGVPLEMQYTVDPLPRMVRGLVIRATYEIRDGLALVTGVEVQVAVSVTFLYRRLYVISVELDDYFDPDA